MLCVKLIYKLHCIKYSYNHEFIKSNKNLQVGRYVTCKLADKNIRMLAASLLQMYPNLEKIHSDGTLVVQSPT